jgi:hypothetical protein
LDTDQLPRSSLPDLPKVIKAFHSERLIEVIFSLFQTALDLMQLFEHLAVDDADLVSHQNEFHGNKEDSCFHKQVVCESFDEQCNNEQNQRDDDDHQGRYIKMLVHCGIWLI